MIPVTKTFFPPLEEYNQYLKRIWSNQWLTNRGELVIELETRLKEHLNIPNIILTTNGTLPLQISLKLLANQGEVITTPFSYVATTSSIIWENCTPVFVDIHPEYLTIDETKIEEAITSHTTAILATHVFGNACNIEVIEKMAIKHNLKVIYDAAHCFGVKYKGNSIFKFGDVSTCSFHATKLFHTGEGGAMISSNDELNHKLYYSHNFGHNGPNDFYAVGINAKMSELQAAMGLSVLPFMEEIMESRKNIINFYNDNLNFNVLKKMELRPGVEWNFSYFPVVFQTEEILLKTLEDLKKKNIFPRRYFFPSLNNLKYIEPVKMPVSDSIASRIVCLPVYPELIKDSFTKLKEICETINRILV